MQAARLQAVSQARLRRLAITDLGASIFRCQFSPRAISTLTPVKCSERVHAIADCEVIACRVSQRARNNRVVIDDQSC
jgi:hypothetical protein